MNMSWLKKNPFKTALPGNKWRVITIWNRVDHHAEIEYHLSNNDFFKELPYNPTQLFKSEFGTLKNKSNPEWVKVRI